MARGPAHGLLETIQLFPASQLLLQGSVAAQDVLALHTTART